MQILAVTGRLLALIAGLFSAFTIQAQTLVPTDVGAGVAGFQDDFDGSTLDARWQATGTSSAIYTVGNGLLHVATAAGDPNHLLFSAAGYDPTVQEVLARIRFTKFGTGDQARGGVGVGVDPSSSQGINYHFRDVTSEGQTGRHTSFLDDTRAWGPGNDFKWQNNVWYWVRLRQESNAASQGGVFDAFAKVWLADGSMAEPSAWQTWDYTPGKSTRSGLAGITAGSSGGVSQFDVDYILIKAAGLPTITVAPEAFPLFTSGPVTIKRQPQSLTGLPCASAMFSVECDGTPPYSFQWYLNDAIIPRATNSTYIIPSVQPVDNGSKYSVVASNVFQNVPRQVTSAPAVLTVPADTVAPALLKADNAGPDHVLLTFSIAVAQSSATNLANYSIASSNGPLTIISASLGNAGTNVLLTTTGQVEGVIYTLHASDIRDECSGTNRIAPDSQASFQAQAYTPVSLGGLTPPGQSQPVSGGYNLMAGGLGLSGASDQAQFSYQPRSGDFDVKVRLDFLIAFDPWAEAGLMAREDTSAGGRFAASLATPGISGAFFKSRGTASTAVNETGAFPVNYPNTWLRLKRSGNQFTGYASYDGQGWAVLGTSSIPFPASILLGFVTSGHNTNQTAGAGFRDFAEVANASTVTPRAPVEPLGQSSRLTSLVISEIMYHPAKVSGLSNLNNSLEFVELFNTAGTSEDISGYRLDGDIHYSFPQGTIIGPGSFLVIARYPSDLAAAYGLSGVLGPYSGNLPNSSGKIQFRNHADAVFLEVNYDSNPPWPAAADGAGHSLVLSHPSLGENQAEAWSASDAVGGSPGRLDPISNDPLRAVVINEFLAHSTPPNVDYIELFNTSGAPIDISGCLLSDDAATNKFTIAGGTVLPARGYIVFDQTQLGFGLKAEGETIFLRSGANNRVLDAIRYEPQGSNAAFGRHPDGAPKLAPLAELTPGRGNPGFLRSEIVINEIMYAPISGDDNDQYLELYNRGSEGIDMSDWEFTSGITYSFPPNTILAPDGYLVVAKNAAHLQSNYPNLGPTNLVGDFGGSLSGKGERIALARPELLVSTNDTGVVSTNRVLVTVHELTYQTGGRWGRWSAGGGSSLELINSEADNSVAANWADSDETQKAPWTTVRASGTVDNGTTTTADELQVLLQGTGECLIDDVQVLNASNANVITNSSFESGATGWTAEGTEGGSSLETSEGYNSSQSFHVRAVDRGDNQVNRIRASLTAPLKSGTTATIQAKVRWLRGDPGVLFRIRGNWLEAIGQMNLPIGAGTPGRRNSRYVSILAPAISEVAHEPVLPGNLETVAVTARIDDLGHIPAVTLYYRLDPAASYTPLAMRDDGQNGDAIGGDGIYSAAIPGQAAGATIAFYIGAIDGASSTFPNDAPARECLIRFGEVQPPGNIPVYRLWMTQATLNKWNGRSKLDNSPLDVTFVLGNQRVIYNTLALYAGSPYIAPGYCGANCGHCGYSITFPKDDLFLGNQDLVLDWPGGHGRETTAIQEQMAYWIANRIGLPYSHRYFIHLHVNGVTDDQRGTIYEAVNQPAGDFISAWLPKATKGDFYKVDRSFDFNDGGGLIADPMPTLQVFTTTGGQKKQARYRWNWNKRSTDNANNYTNIFSLVDAVNAASPEPYTSGTEELVDTEEWMGIFAVEHIINNFDSWGHDIGKNMYVYKPDGDKWQLYMFDLDWLMIVSEARYTASNGPLFNANDPTVVRMYNHPPFRRAYFRAVLDAVNGPLAAMNCEPVMDEKYNSLVANGVRYCDGAALTSPAELKTWFRDRRTFLLNQLAAVAANFSIAGESQITASANPITLSGTASVEVKSIRINGNEWPITWTTVTNWTTTFFVNDAETRLEVVAYDKRGNRLAGMSNTVSVSYSGPVTGLPPIYINEWMASNTKTLGDLSFGTPKYDDWFELYNAGTTTADLSGLYLTDDPANKFQFKIPPGYTIAADGHLLVWADGEPDQNSATNSDLHVSFQLSAKGEAIGLFAADGSQLDFVSFGPQASDVSEGRCPDGSTNIVSFPVASPRLANDCAVAPVLQSMEWANGQVIFAWNVIPASSYRMEFKDDLNDVAWTALDGGAPATSATLSVTIDPSSPHRFYRLTLIN